MKLCTIYIEEYGALRDKRIDFSDGLNLIQGANESGKSTVCAFIKFIFYGHADSKERELRTSVSSGVSSGYAVFEHSDGKLYRIDRREADGKSKATVFCESNGESLKKISVPLGEYFLGIPEKLYTRSVFISQKSAPELDKQSSEAVSSLLTGGSEAMNVKRAERSLDEMRKEYRLLRGRAGLIPETEDEILRVRQRFNLAVEKKLRLGELNTEIQRLSEEKARMEAQISGISENQDTESRASGENAFVLNGDYVSELRELSHELEFSEKNALALSSFNRAEPISPKGYEVFENNPDKEDYKKAFATLMSSKKKFTAISAVALAASLIFFVLSGISAVFIALGCGFLVFGAFSVFIAYNLSKAFSEFSGETESKTLPEIDAFYSRCQSYKEAKAAFEEHKSYAEGLQAELEEKRDMLAEMLRRSGSKSVAEAVEKIEKVNEKRANASESIARLNLRLHELHIDRARMEGERFEDAGELSALEGALCERLAEYEKSFDAAKLALEALGEAQKSVRRTFIPQISDIGGRYFERLTGGKYQSLALGSELELSCRQDKDTLPLAEEHFSGGSYALAWLCLRLALVGRLADGKLPMILDEPFVYFDEARLSSALVLLKEIADSGVQILLFSASDREKRVLGKTEITM